MVQNKFISCFYLHIYFILPYCQYIVYVIIWDSPLVSPLDNNLSTVSSTSTDILTNSGLGVAVLSFLLTVTMFSMFFPPSSAWYIVPLLEILSLLLSRSYFIRLLLYWLWKYVILKNPRQSVEYGRW